MSPLVGLYRPRSSRPNVVLPDPVSPTRASVSPRLIASDTPSTALSIGRLRGAPGGRPTGLARMPTLPWPTAKYLDTSMVWTIGVSGSAADMGAILAHVGPQSIPASARPAVHVEHGAGDVRGGGRGEEQHGAGDVGRVTGHAERYGLHERLPQLIGCPVGIGVAPAAHVDVAGGDHVDPDAVRA